jgi:hypothetical protein
MSTPLDEELVILNLVHNNYIALDKVARRIWELLDQVRTVQDVCKCLSLEYEDPDRRLCADVLEFLDELESEGLLVVED